MQVQPVQADDVIHVGDEPVHVLLDADSSGKIIRLSCVT